MTNLGHNSNDSRPLAALEAELRQLPQPEPPEGLEAALISAIPPTLRTRCAARRNWRAPFVASAAAAAAAFLLVGLSVWAVPRAERRDAPRRIVTTPVVQAAPVALPRASCVAYYRAWLQSPDALDKMLTRDGAVLLRPERNMSELNVRGLLETINLNEERHNEKQSMRGRVPGALV